MRAVRRCQLKFVLVLDLTLSSVVLHFWDLGGDKSLRRLWPRYYSEADALLWVMDIRDWFGVSNITNEDNVDDDENESYRTRRRNASCEELGKSMSTPLSLFNPHRSKNAC